MANYKIRPRFKVESNLEVEEVRTKIFDHFEQNKVKCNADFLGSNIVIELPISERTFWTPQLSLNIYKNEEEKTVISGRFGPASNPWLIYLFTYGFLGILAMSIGIYGGTRMQLGKDAEILWALPVIIGITLILYLVSLFGQRKSAHQIQYLKEGFENALDIKIPK